MRKSFDGLMAIIRDTYQLDPYANNRVRDKPRFPYNGYDHQEQTF